MFCRFKTIIIFVYRITTNNNMQNTYKYNCSIGYLPDLLFGAFGYFANNIIQYNNLACNLRFFCRDAMHCVSTKMHCVSTIMQFSKYNECIAKITTFYVTFITHIYKLLLQTSEVFKPSDVFFFLQSYCCLYIHYVTLYTEKSCLCTKSIKANTIKIYLYFFKRKPCTTSFCLYTDKCKTYTDSIKVYTKKFYRYIFSLKTCTVSFYLYTEKCKTYTDRYNLYMDYILLCNACCRYPQFFVSRNQCTTISNTLLYSLRSYSKQAKPCIF